jgi:hypothetical protein
MSDVPLPDPAYIAGSSGMLGESVWDRKQMHAHAAAVSAADNARLREEVARLTKIIDDAWGEA